VLGSVLEPEINHIALASKFQTGHKVSADNSTTISLHGQKLLK